MTNIKSVLITGSGSGLGRATALQFANAGYRVFAGVRDTHAAPGHAAIVPVLLDVADPAQIAAAAELIDRECPDGLTALVNMAGYTFYGPVEHTSDTAVSALFDVVAFAPYRLANAVLPALKRYARATGRRSKILNIISWAAFDATPFVGFYAAAKAAALRITQAQFFELDRFGIDAVSIVPGMMKTQFIEHAEVEIRAANAQLVPQARADYGDSIDHMATLSAAAPRNPIVASPAAIAARIVAVASKRRARSQYNFGIDTWLIGTMSRLLPLRLFEAIKRTMFGLRSSSQAWRRSDKLVA
ncbi:MAG TPA: SDR family NAD(P)-dependent oxidoreductase [Kofleriaceae bacterium]|jgi:NAD(P)-dependent dehydrogenase (short-subunit alcohol dehydrogenase family)